MRSPLLGVGPNPQLLTISGAGRPLGHIRAPSQGWEQVLWGQLLSNQPTPSPARLHGDGGDFIKPGPRHSGVSAIVS